MSDTAVRPTNEKSYGATDTSTPPWWKALVRWESGLVLVLLAVIWFGSSESADFFNTATIYYVGLSALLMLGYAGAGFAARLVVRGLSWRALLYHSTAS